MKLRLKNKYKEIKFYNSLKYLRQLSSSIFCDIFNTPDKVSLIYVGTLQSDLTYIQLCASLMTSKNW